jgi:hypothetical protein
LYLQNQKHALLVFFSRESDYGPKCNGVAMPDFVLQWVYATGDFNTAGPLDAVPNEQGAQAQGSPPWQLELNATASPQQIIVNDDDGSLNEIGDPGQVLAVPITIDGTTYPAGSRVVINYVLTTDDGFEGYSITLGSNNTGNNTTTAFITNSPMVPGQTYEFTSEGNIGNSDGVLYSQFACFTLGTSIKTAEGDRSIEQLSIGSLVQTRDNGLQPIRWIGQRCVPAIGSMAPISFRKGTLGAVRDTLVSPNHRMLVTGEATQLLLGVDEAFVAAKHLINGQTILRRPNGLVFYIHIMFDRHEVICGDGVWSESFFADGCGLGVLNSDQMNEILSLFPELKGQRTAQLAKPGTKAYEGRVIAEML